MITPSFLLALATFTRQRDNAIGIHHQTAVQERLYTALDESVIEQGVKRAITAQIDGEVHKLIAEGNQTEKSPGNIAKHRQLGRDIELGVTILEYLANG